MMRQLSDSDIHRDKYLPDVIHFGGEGNSDI